MLHIVAQVPTGAVQDVGSIVAYAVLTIALLGISVLILLKVSSQRSQLILLGLVVAVTSIGYGSMIAGAVPLAGMLMKIGVLLVLSGAACVLLSYLSRQPSSEITDTSGGPAPKLW